jgi:Methyltransferase domain
VTRERPERKSGHLGYYKQYGISPVRYDIGDLPLHFDRRDSLYRSLALPAVAFKSSRVLEVAPGSGENGLYIAACHPASFDLVEANPVAVRDLSALYGRFESPHTRPKIHPMRFEQFEATSAFDIVVCENWLGSLPHEIELIKKLASLVAPGGALVMTITPTSGFFPNIMRKLLANRITDPTLSFEEKTRFLIGVFGSHLQTISGMTRTASDWIQDCMLNPHYFHIVISLDTLVEAIGGEMELLSSFPRFTSDWRWFKSLTGANRRFNDNAMIAYHENMHNFFNYRKTWPPRSATANAQLTEAFNAVHQAAIRWETAAEMEDGAEIARLNHEIGELLSKISTSIAEIDSDIVLALDELKAVWSHPSPDGEMIKNMRAFGALFGRETVYVSFTRPRANS